MQNIPLTFDEHEVIKFFPILYLCLSSPVEIDCFLHKYMFQFTHLDLNYFSFYPNCQLLKCPFKNFASFIVEILVNKNHSLLFIIYPSVSSSDKLANGLHRIQYSSRSRTMDEFNAGSNKKA